MLRLAVRLFGILLACEMLSTGFAFADGSSEIPAARTEKSAQGSTTSSRDNNANINSDYQAPNVSGSDSSKAKKFPSLERLDEINSRSSGDVILESERSILRSILFYLPNRIIDLFDVFRIDIGAGSSAGVVLRATRYGQVGYRFVDPVSLRLGAFGRSSPIVVERNSESGFGDNFSQTPNRHVTPYEIGIGADLLIGAYAGVSLDELADFLTGILFIDWKGDDIGS